MRLSPGLKRALHWVGGALAVLGIAFVVLRLREYGVGPGLDLGWRGWLSVGILASVYGAANLMLAGAWWHLLEQYGGGVSLRWAVRTYGVSQIAKYVPGNIFHLAGRQALGVAAEVPAWPLAKSAVWELGLLSGAGALYGFLVLPAFVPGLAAAAGTLMFLAALVLSLVLLRRRAGPQAALAFAWHLGFLAVSGLVFAVLAVLMQAVVPPTPWLMLVGAYVLAWLAGVLTPGAPAGVGVRELVLLLLLDGRVTEAALVQAVVLGRVVTVAGDLGFLLLAWLMKGGPAWPGGDRVD